jgi:hypothetical protein
VAVVGAPVRAIGVGLYARIVVRVNKRMTARLALSSMASLFRWLSTGLLAGARIGK